MRAYMNYQLFIGTEMFFAQWPQIVVDVLRGLGISDFKFAYRLECISGNGCERAATENPILGTVCTDPARTGYMHAILTGDCSEEAFLVILPKLCRRYGISDIYLTYSATDTQGRNVNVCLHRQNETTARWSGIELQVSIENEEDFAAADAYRDALISVFPVRKSWGRVETEFSDAETAQYAEWNRQAQPLAREAANALDKIRKTPKLMLVPAKSKSLGTLLKKMCAKYGYTYVMYEYHMYFIQKRTENGHIISLEVNNGRCGDECNIAASFSGLGFEHRVGYASCHAPSKELFLDQFFQALTEVERDILSKLDTLFPPTPNWYRTI